MRYGNCLLYLLFSLIPQLVSAQPTVSFQGYKEVNGTKLYCKVIGQGEPILVIHGGPSMNHDYFLPHLEALAANHKLIFYDQRASGASPIPPDSSKDISYRIMVDDIEALRNAFSISKLNIMAHSWGGKLAINYALQYPEHLGKLVLISPITFSHEYDSIQLATIAAKTTTADKEARKQLVGSKAFLHGDMDVYKQVLMLMYKNSFYDTLNLAKLNIILPADFYHANAVLTRGLMNDHNRYDKNYYPQLKKIKVPLLILQGTADNLPLAAAQRLQSIVPNAQLIVFDKSGHFPFIEEQEKFTNVVTTFIDGK